MVKTFYGTKNLIECKLSLITLNAMPTFKAAYIHEQELSLEFVRDSTELSNEEKKRFFKSANTNLGTSALCLSGGASFGYCAQYLSSPFICSWTIQRPFRRCEGVP